MGCLEKHSDLQLILLPNKKKKKKKKEDMSHLNQHTSALTEEHAQNLLKALGPVQTRLTSHPLYSNVKNAKGIRTFMRSHVFAVWDFMALLKRLQNDLTCTKYPWIPGRDAEASRFINEIVLGEECDIVTPGTKPTSHYDLYLRAMREVEADPKPIEAMLKNLHAHGGKWEPAVEQTRQQFANSLPKETFDFVKCTFRVCDARPVHEVAAYFLYGREDPIPQMFQNILGTLEAEKVVCDGFILYLKRHIEVDSEDHGPMALRLIKHLCGDDEKKWHEATATAIEAIEHRITLWDGILRDIKNQS